MLQCIEICFMHLSEANLNIFLTKLHTDHTGLEPSRPHPSGLRVQPPRNIVDTSLQIDFAVPKSLSQYARSYPYFLLNIVRVGQFAPHAYFSAYYVHAWIAGLKFVKVAPGYVSPVIIAFEAAVAQIKVGIVVVRENDFVGFVGNKTEVLSQSPPLQNVVGLQRQIDFFVCPIDDLFAEIFPINFFLSYPVVNRKLLIGLYVVLVHPLANRWPFVPTFLVHFVPTEMDIWVFEDFACVVHHLLDHFIGEVESGIELSCEWLEAVDYYVLILVTAAPGLRMRWRIDLGNHSHPFPLGIHSDLSDILGRVSPSDLAVGTEFGDCWHFKGETFLVDYMPMQNVHLVEHHHIYLILYGVHWQEVTC